ncbi:MAG: hypothetical protein L0Z55_02300, partial [Planctomycetes bacterium]|nr:hypothetical protein [Planctomycetota bacterium]
HIRPRERLRFLRAYDRGEGVYWRRDWIRALDDELAEETIRILTRLSREEAQLRNGGSAGDPRFESPPRP